MTPIVIDVLNKTCLTRSRLIDKAVSKARLERIQVNSVTSYPNSSCSKKLQTGCSSMVIMWLNQHVTVLKLPWPGRLVEVAVSKPAIRRN